MRRFYMFFVLIGLLYVDPVAAAETQSYCNSKYNYCLEVPTFLRAQGEPPAQDGQIFLSQDGLSSIKVWGSWNVLNQTLEQHLKVALKDRKITFRQVFKNAYILSGYQANQIFYQKTIFENDRFRTVLFQYPKSQKKQFDSVITPTIKSFIATETTPSWAGMWKFSEKNDRESHYLLLKGSPEKPVGIYTGSEDSEYLFFFKVAVSNLIILPDGTIRFRLGPRYLLSNPQSPKTPPLIKNPFNAGKTGVELNYVGKISGNSLRLQCKTGAKGTPGIDECWKPAMDFIRITTP
jgi:hypothetical protein